MLDLCTPYAIHGVRREAPSSRRSAGRIPSVPQAASRGSGAMFRFRAVDGARRRCSIREGRHRLTECFGASPASGARVWVVSRRQDSAQKLAENAVPELTPLTQGAGGSSVGGRAPGCKRF